MTPTGRSYYWELPVEPTSRLWQREEKDTYARPGELYVVTYFERGYPVEQKIYTNGYDIQADAAHWAPYLHNCYAARGERYDPTDQDPILAMNYCSDSGEAQYILITIAQHFGTV